jgi:CheY-like chemotaxis protein
LTLRDCISEALTDAIFRVIEAPTADEAMTVLRSRDYVNAVLTDIEMLGSMDGLALAATAMEAKPGARQ